MSNWKGSKLGTEPYRAPSLILVIFTGFVVLFCMPMTVYAQEPVAREEVDEYDLLIEEALDQIENNFDPILRDGDAVIEPVAADISEEAVEMEVIDLSTAIVADLVITQKDVEPKETVEAAEPVTENRFETKVIPLMYAEASGLIDMLSGMKSDEGEVLYDEEKRTLILTDTIESVLAMEAFIKEVDILLETETFQMEYANAEDVVEDIEEVLTENVGQVNSDEEVDSIVITDTPAKIVEIKKLIATLDRFDKEILIEAKVVQILLNDEHLDGVDWEAIVSAYQELAFSGFESQAKDPLRLGTISREDYVILLEALDTVGVVRTVLESDMIADSGIKKTVDIFVPALEVDFDEDGPRPSKVGQEEDRIEVSVTPTMKRGGPLAVSVAPRFWGAILQEGQEPKESVVQIKEGETIVIGSLFKEIVVSSEWKIPLLGDLPLLGFVFRKGDKDLRKTEVVIFLTIKTHEKK